MSLGHDIPFGADIISISTVTDETFADFNLE